MTGDKYKSGELSLYVQTYQTLCMCLRHCPTFLVSEEEHKVVAWWGFEETVIFSEVPQTSF